MPSLMLTFFGLLPLASPGNKPQDYSVRSLRSPSGFPSSSEDEGPRSETSSPGGSVSPASRERGAETIYFPELKRLKVFLRLRSKRVRPKSHTRLKFPVL